MLLTDQLMHEYSDIVHSVRNKYISPRYSGFLAFALWTVISDTQDFR